MAAALGLWYVKYAHTSLMTVGVVLLSLVIIFTAITFSPPNLK